MTDSSEEDLSRFREVVDATFIKLINNNTSNKLVLPQYADRKPKSKRYLEEATHYNDVKVSKQLQEAIGAKVSEIINRKLKFVDVEDDCLKNETIQGGVKLFKDSVGFLSCEEVVDTYTENHNNLSKKIKKKRRRVDKDFESIDEKEKLKSVAVSGDYILCKEEIKCWKSRRKDKIFKYKQKDRSNVLTAVE